MNGVFDEITYHRCPMFEETCLIEELLQCSQHLWFQFGSLLCELMVMNGVFDEITHHRCPMFEETCLIEELLQCSQHHWFQFGWLLCVS